MDKVQHFEIPADDINRAKKFYEASFGWKMKDWPLPDGSTYVGIYTGPVDKENMWLEPGFINGGMVQRGGQFPITHPVITVVVPDIEDALGKVIESGGTLFMDKREIPQMGRYAYVRDSEGNILGIWQDLKKKE